MRKRRNRGVSRRRWLAGSALATGAAFGLPGAFAAPAARTLADLVPEKGPLRLLNDRPLNAETPAHLLNDDTTPTELLFVRNNGMPPVEVEADTWRLKVHGESCIAPQSFSIAELKSRFPVVSYDLQLECGGNGRAEFRPRASGNQWTTGAVGCPRWTGVRVKDLLAHCGVRDDAVYLAYVGADSHLSGDRDKLTISRGVPMGKALEAETLVAFELNGAPITALHGAPLRLVAGGWPGSVSGKWLTELLVRDRVHDGPKMTGTSYRVPCSPVPPGASVPDEGMCIIESMPVKSLITRPRSGVEVKAGRKLTVGGHAWAGDLQVSAMHVSLDFGATWQNAELTAPVNRLAWQHWQAEVQVPDRGYYELWARATDELGRSQPMLVPGWNPKGYLNNAAHRIAVHAV